MKLDIDIKIYEGHFKSVYTRKSMFKDYKLNYKPKSITDLIEYLKSKKYKIVAFDTFDLISKNTIHISIEKQGR